MSAVNLLEFDRESLSDHCERLGEKRFRATQARSITALEPASKAPTGAPSPFEHESMTVSAHAEKSATRFGDSSRGWPTCR